jgi:hypothetical protein
VIGIAAAHLRRQGAVRDGSDTFGHVHQPARPRGGDFSGSSAVASRNPLIQNGATNSSKSERFDAEGVPPCCYRGLSVTPDGLLATVNFRELPFRNCLEIRDRSRIGAPRAAKRGRRSPDSGASCRQRGAVRRLRLFSKQFPRVNSANFAITEFSEVAPALLTLHT